MTEDSGAKLLAAVESLVAEIRGLREDRSRDGAAREELESLRARSRERAKKSRDKCRMSRDSNVTASRHGNVTPGSLVLSSSLRDQDQKKELKILASRDGDVTLGLRQETWAAYSAAYSERYGAEPLRNAEVNSKIKQIVKRLGAEAPDVATFFVMHPLPWYATKGHAIGVMLSDAEKLRTEWATGRPIAAPSRQQERTSAMGAVVAQIIRERENGVG